MDSKGFSDSSLSPSVPITAKILILFSMIIRGNYVKDKS